MTKPQQPELARNRRGDRDQDGKDLHAGGAEDRPEGQQDKPDSPPA